MKKWAAKLFASNPLVRNLACWRERCGGAPDFQFVEYVLTHGLVVADPEQRPEAFDMDNHGSCGKPGVASKVSEILKKENEDRFITVPPAGFAELSGMWVHALGVVPKAAKPGAVRIIHDFSAPAADCLNAHIDYLRMSYDRVDTAFASLRQGSWLAKIDISAFFRHIPVDPADWCLLGFRWDGSLFVDTRLNFGQRNASEVAMRFSLTVLWHVQQRIRAMRVGRCEVSVVCDDWLVVCDTEADCRAVWLMVIEALQALGFTVNTEAHKCIAPCFCLVWLGLELDSVAMTVRLPADKLAKALALVTDMSTKRKVTRRELDSLFGYLSFCCSVVYGGRAFLHGVRRLRFRPNGGVRGARDHVHVTMFFRADMLWWILHLALLNGDLRTRIVSMHMADRVDGVSIDARGGSGGVGMFVFGGFLGLTGEQVNARYPAGGKLVSPGCWDVPSTDANHWEMFAFIVLLDMFASCFAGKYVVIDSDSMTACRCVRDLTAALDSPQLGVLTRQFLALCVQANVRVLPRHIPGVDNVLADPLSRGNWPAFGVAALQWCGARGFGQPQLLRSFANVPQL